MFLWLYFHIVYMCRNPTPGKIINRPDGDDVYHGVPKDYSGLTVSNFQLVHQLIYM